MVNFLFIMWAFCQIHSPGPSFELKKETPWVDNHIEMGRATLSTPTTKPVSGEMWDVELRFDNEHVPLTLYNAFFDPRISPQPGALAIFDSQGHFQCDLFLRLLGTPRFNTTTIVPDSYVGRKTQVRLLTLDDKPIAPGRYKVQLIYYRCFVDINNEWPKNLSILLSYADQMCSRLRSCLRPISNEAMKRGRSPNSNFTHTRLLPRSARLPKTLPPKKFFPLPPPPTHFPRKMFALGNPPFPHALPPD